MPTLDPEPEDNDRGQPLHTRVEDEIREILDRTSFGESPKPAKTPLPFPTPRPSIPRTLSPIARIGLCFLFALIGALFSIQAPLFAWAMGVVSFLTLASLWLPTVRKSQLPPSKSLDQRFDEWRRGR